jgi:Flp pilus assembly protein protease CpaA
MRPENQIKDAVQQIATYVSYFSCACLLLCLNVAPSIQVLMGILFLASFFDVKTNRIPNWLTYSGILVAPIFPLVAQFVDCPTSLSPNNFLPTLLGGLICGTFLLVLWILKIAGGGDVKLVFAIGLFLGVIDGVTVILLTHLIAAICIVIGKLMPKLIRFETQDHYESNENRWIPMAGFYTAGVLATILLSHY